MSHNCPECSALCHCCGDIDDCCFDLPEDKNKCVHYKICDIEDNGDDEGWTHDFESNPETTNPSTAGAQPKTPEER